MTSSTERYEPHPDVVWADASYLPPKPLVLAASQEPVQEPAKLATCFCSKCTQHKSPDDFYRTNRLQTKGTCKKCWSEYMSERRKDKLGAKVTAREHIKALEEKFYNLRVEVRTLLVDNLELRAKVENLESKLSAHVVAHIEQNEARKVEAGEDEQTYVTQKRPTSPTSSTKPAALTTADLRAALKQSRENPSTPVKMDSYYLLGGTPCAYGMNKSVTTDVDRIKPYTTEFEPIWKQMRKEDKLAQIEADKDNPLADLM